MRSKASPLADRPVLLVAALHDSEAPIDFHHRPLAEAFRWAGHPMLTELMFDTDHAFSDHRVALARSTVEWLDGLLQSTGGEEREHGEGEGATSAGPARTPGWAADVPGL